MVKNEAGEYYDLNLTICFLTSEKHSFGVHTDKSPKICTNVEQIFLNKAGLLLNIDVAVPFLKSKNIAKNCVSIQCTPHCQGVSVSPTLVGWLVGNRGRAVIHYVRTMKNCRQPK